MLTTVPSSGSIATRLGKAVVLTVAIVFALTAAAPAEDGASMREGRFQEKMNAVLDPIILNNYDIYAEAGFNGDGTAYVAFTAPLAADAKEAIQAQPAIELIENAAMTADDADELMIQLMTVADGGSGDSVAVFIHVNPVDGRAEVAVSEPLDEATQSALRTIAPQVTVEVDASLTWGTTDDIKPSND